MYFVYLFNKSHLNKMIQKDPQFIAFWDVNGNRIIVIKIKLALTKLNWRLDYVMSMRLVERLSERYIGALQSKY